MQRHKMTDNVTLCMILGVDITHFRNICTYWTYGRHCETEPYFENGRRHCDIHVCFQVLGVIFDIRNLKYTEWAKAIVPFVSVHNNYKEEYKLHLIGTIVFLNSTKTKTILDTLFSSLYFPARPIEFVTDDSIDKEKYIENFWPTHS